jgi:hypothetical protein
LSYQRAMIALASPQEICWTFAPRSSRCDVGNVLFDVGGVFVTRSISDVGIRGRSTAICRPSNSRTPPMMRKVMPIPPSADEDHRRPPPVGDCSPALGCEPTQFVLHVLHWRGQALVPRQSPRPDLLRPAPHPRGRRPILEQPRGGANEAAMMRSWFIAAQSPGLPARTRFSAGPRPASARNALRMSRRARRG